MILIKSGSLDIKAAPPVIFSLIVNSPRDWFAEFFTTNDSNPIKMKKPHEVDYIFRITKQINFSKIYGTVEPQWNSSLDKIRLKIELKPLNSEQTWTRLSYSIEESDNTYGDKWWIVVPAGVIPLIALLEKGLVSFQQAYATTMPIIAPTANIPVISSVNSSIPFSKIILATIALSIITVTGGVIVIADGYYTDLYVDYSVSPQQIPAELFGTLITVKDVSTTDNKNTTINYHCDVDPIVYELNYTFDCFTENLFGHKQVVTVDVSIISPNDRLDKYVQDCVSQYYLFSDNLTNNYPELLNLPNFSSSHVSLLKYNHIKQMDNYYENNDYASSKKHATIVLKYFSVNDVQALSTLGNAIRDEDRTNIDGINCAIAIHNTPFLSSTVWGKISLAEDYHVLGEYQKSIHWSSQIIDDYGYNLDVEETHYVNALIIKANALYRLALYGHTGYEEAKMYYMMAHDIRESYATWFGLGNIDRHEGKFGDALEKYKQAKMLTENTDEINKEINSILSHSEVCKRPAICSRHIQENF